MRVSSALLRREAERLLSSEHAGWAKGSCVTSRRIHEAVLRASKFDDVKAMLPEEMRVTKQVCLGVVLLFSGTFFRSCFYCSLAPFRI